MALTGLLMCALCTVPDARAQPGSTSPTLTVTYAVGLEAHYSVFGHDYQNIALEIQGANLSSEGPIDVEAVFWFSFAGITGLSPGANYTITQGNSGDNHLQVVFPAGSSAFNFTVAGSSSDYSVLLRSAASIQPVSVFANVPPFSPSSSRLTVTDPPTMDVFSVSGGDPGAVFQTTSVGDSHYITSAIPISNGILVLYQGSGGDVLLVLYMAIVAMTVIWVPVVYRRTRGAAGRVATRILSFTNAFLEWFTAKRLLQVFVGTALAMLGIALVFGPSPAPRVYLAATPATTDVLGPVISGAGFSYLTPANAGDQFGTMSTLGNYNLVVLADFAPGFGSIGLATNYHLLVLTQYAPPGYGSTLKAVYGGSVTLLNSTQELEALLNNARFYVPASNLGFAITEKQYAVSLVMEAVLTFLLIFVALAFLSRALIEKGERGFGAIAQGVFYSIGVFMATTVVLIQTSVLLGIPVVTHAAISSVETAVGSLGFGGGSRPRQLVGTLGLLFGAVAGKAGRMKIDRVGALAFIGVVTFIAIDPLSLGQEFYQVAVTFSTNISAPVGAVADQNARGLLSGVMNLFGHNISAFFYSSHGSVLFFASSLPLAVFSRVRKSTATFLLLITAFVAPVGFLRVADLNPTESMASAIPGVVIGFGLIALVLAVSFFESKLRKTLPTI